MNMITTQSIQVGTGKEKREIVLEKNDGGSPGVIWLGGFRSDMTGTKAQVVMDWARSRGLAGLRFDYSGHGISGGEFRDGSISRWLEESLSVFRAYTKGPQIIVGSSMGGWIALRLIQELQKCEEEERVGGVVLVAPAPDFTSMLMEPKLTESQRNQLENLGYIEEESEYSDEPVLITKKLIEDGRANSVMDTPLKLGCPVHIIQGRLDADVPYTHALQLSELLAEDDVTITLVSDGDHRLSNPRDIARMVSILDDIALPCGN